MYSSGYSRIRETKPWIILFIIGGLLFLARALIPEVPITAGGQTYTLGQAHALCTSAIGTFAQALSSNAATDCATIANWYGLLNVITVAGIGCIIAGIILITVRKDT